MKDSYDVIVVGAGADVDLIDTRQALELHPLLDATRIAGAAFEPLSGFADCPVSPTCRHVSRRAGSSRPPVRAPAPWPDPGSFPIRSVGAVSLRDLEHTDFSIVA